MSKPKNMTPEQDEAWREKENATQKAYRQSPKYKARQKAYRESPEGKARKKAYNQSVLSQAAADQFFIMAAAAQALSEIQTNSLPCPPSPN